MRKLGLAVAVVAAAAFLTGCSSEDLSPANSAVTQVIDVRTASEFAAGHIAGAINIDVEAGDFSTKVAALPKAGVYLVYCHSGRRSAIAAQQMQEAGFTVLDGGGIQSMLDRGWSQGS